jgi:adenosylhomocysteine nucleosidase
MRSNHGVRLLLICPIPYEFNACRSVLDLRDTDSLGSCRTARGTLEQIDLVAVESGPGKARAAAATALACLQCAPDLVLDTGSCAGLASSSSPGDVILATECYEYDIGGKGVPREVLPAMRLPSALLLLEAPLRNALRQQAIAAGPEAAVSAGTGIQACGELLVRSSAQRRSLNLRLGAVGANWETAAVFVAAHRSGIPALSLRVVTDRGDATALADFRRQIRSQSRKLYGYIRELAGQGWFGRFRDGWSTLGEEKRRALPRSVRQ